MERPSDFEDFFSHLAALAAASGAASLVLFFPTWTMLPDVWPVICLYGLIFAMPLYALAFKLGHTGWIGAAALGCASTAPLLLFTGTSPWILHLGAAGAVAGLTFRLVVAILIGTSWLPPPAPDDDLEK